MDQLFFKQIEEYIAYWN